MILGAYEELRKSRFLGLPHRTTLNRYTSFTSSGAGFNCDIVKRLYGDLKVSTLQRYEKQAILLFDEIKTKSGLEYSKSTGCIYIAGDINEELNEFERKFQTFSSKSKELATYAICFMAGQFLKGFSYPISFPENLPAISCFLLHGEPLGYLKQLGWKELLLFATGQHPTGDFLEQKLLKMC